MSLETENKNDQKNGKTERLAYLDFLKVLALAGIVLAHVSSPDWLLMLRSFDVPMMVMISALLGRRSWRKKYAGTPHGRIHWFQNRFRRLVFPVWIFLACFFLFKAWLGDIRSLFYYRNSFLLTRYGIGYVWVILIYLYVSFFLPWISDLPLNRKTVFLSAAVYALYELAFFLKIGVGNRFLDSTVYMMIPYGVLSLLAIEYEQMNRKQRKFTVLASMILFLGFALLYDKVTGQFQLVSVAKYPPRMYYLSYGCFCTFLLYEICSRKDRRIFHTKEVKFISSHSMWLYLWQIVALDILEQTALPGGWIAEFFFVWAVSILLVLAVNAFLDLLEKHGVHWTLLLYLRG